MRAYHAFESLTNILLSSKMSWYIVIEESNADVVHMNAYFNTTDDFEINSKIKIEKNFDSISKPRFLSDNSVTRMEDEFLPVNLNVVPWKKISRRDFFIESGLYFPITPRSNDLLQLFGELCFARKVQVIDACGYVRRINPESVMWQSAEKHLRRALKSLPTTADFVHEVFFIAENNFQNFTV